MPSIPKIKKYRYSLGQGDYAEDRYIYDSVKEKEFPFTKAWFKKNKNKIDHKSKQMAREWGL